MDQRNYPNGLAMKVLFTVCDLGAAATLGGWFWPIGMAEVPVYALSLEMMGRAVAAGVLAMGALFVLVAIWTDPDTTATNSPRR
jgi:hypothetical protein